MPAVIVPRRCMMTRVSAAAAAPLAAADRVGECAERIELAFLGGAPRAQPAEPRVLGAIGGAGRGRGRAAARRGARRVIDDKGAALLSRGRAKIVNSRCRAPHCAFPLVKPAF